jgi:MFS transporter, ACS family, tartrate transporter
MTHQVVGEVPSMEAQVMRRVLGRILPFLMILFVMNVLDRSNVSVGALGMNRDLNINQSLYGLGAGIFFIGYFLFEIPSNILLHRFGARIWIARIMISWGVIASLMCLLRTPGQFLILRFLLGVAEAGFFPGVVFYLSLWVPAKYKAKAMAGFYIGFPVAQVIGAPLSAGLMHWGQTLGWSGWRVMYLCEGVPALVLGIVCLFYLTDSPGKAKWLTREQRLWLIRELAEEQRSLKSVSGASASKSELIREVLQNPVIWILSGFYFGITCGSNALNFFLPTVLQSLTQEHGLHIGLVEIGFLSAVPYATAGVAMYWWGKHSDRSQERRAHSGMAAVFGATAFSVSLIANSPTAIMGGFTLFAVGLYCAINVFWTIPATLVTGLQAATAIALVNSIGNLSGFFAPMLMGRLYVHTGSYRISFFVIALVVGTAGLGLSRFPLMRERKANLI